MCYAEVHAPVSLVPSLIVSTLERRFPLSAGYAPLFPSRKHGGNAGTGLLKALSKHWVDNVLFPLASTFVPWDRLPNSFRKDREAVSIHSSVAYPYLKILVKLIGAPLNVEGIVASRDSVLSTLSSHLVSVFSCMVVGAFVNDCTIGISRRAAQ